MTDKEKRDRDWAATQLLVDLGRLQNEAISIGLYRGANFINAAMNMCGWELAGRPDAARVQLIDRERT